MSGTNAHEATIRPAAIPVPPSPMDNFLEAAHPRKQGAQMEDKCYSPDEFVRLLTSNELASRFPLEISGLVKHDEKEPAILYLAPLGCGTWIQVPLSSVLHVTDLGMRPCRGHTHRYARVRLRESPGVECELLRLLLQSGTWEGESAEPLFTPRHSASAWVRPKQYSEAGPYPGYWYDDDDDGEFNECAECLRRCGANPGCKQSCMHSVCRRSRRVSFRY
jgi:hypothetical protein